MRVAELYERSIRALSAAERLALAKLILNDLSPSVVDEGDHWSDEDLREFAAATWARAEPEASSGDRDDV